MRALALLLAAWASAVSLAWVWRFLRGAGAMTRVAAEAPYRMVARAIAASAVGITALVILTLVDVAVELPRWVVHCANGALAGTMFSVWHKVMTWVRHAARGGEPR